MHSLAPLLTIPDTAKVLGVSEDTVEALIHQEGPGRLPAFRVGRQWRIDPRRLGEWMDQQIADRQA
jgi:excisionase family DNA binding protein